MNKLLFFGMFLAMSGCIKPPPPYITPDAARPELPDAGEEGDAGLPEAGDSGVDGGDAGSSTDGGE
tara:strand:+ start:1044 stop:1241 length:198 start_codon:yes stop_codon:yes gene_type:complete